MAITQAGVYAVSVVLALLATLSVGLRLQAARLRKSALGATDYTIFVALFLDWVIALTLIVGASKGVIGTQSIIDPQTGKLIVQPEDKLSSEYGYVVDLLTVAADGTLKISLLLLYRRIFVGKWFERVSLSLCVLVAAWTIAFFVGTLLWCGSHLSAFWTSSASVLRYCGSFKGIQLGWAASDVATDLIILCVPLPLVSRLQTNRAWKIELLLIFSLGFLSIAFGIARMVTILQSEYSTTVGARDLRDITTRTLLWGYIELAVGTITASVVTFRPLVADRSAASIVHSVRSVMSLRSWRSGSLGNRPQLHGNASPRIHEAVEGSESDEPSSVRVVAEPKGAADHVSTSSVSETDIVVKQDASTRDLEQGA